jgi:hypothetical protein
MRRKMEKKNLFLVKMVGLRPADVSFLEIINLSKLEYLLRVPNNKIWWADFRGSFQSCRGRSV